LTRSAFQHRLEPLDVGRDSITPIDPAYRSKWKFEVTGRIEKLALELIRCVALDVSFARSHETELGQA
jgi:arylsulfatase